MVNFEVIEDRIIFTYNYSDYINSDWVRKGLREDGCIYYKSTFYFTKEDLYSEESLEEKKLDPATMSILDVEIEPISFVFAEKTGDYFKVKKNVLSDKSDIYFHKDIDLVLEYFVAETKISLFKQIISLTNEDIYIGGTNSNSIPFNSFEELIKKFPNTYEKKFICRSQNNFKN